MAAKFNQEVLPDDVARVSEDSCAHTTQVFSVVLFIYHNFASYLALRYVILIYFRNEYMDSDFLRLVRLRPTMMPVEGVSFRAPWRSMCLLRDYFVP